VVVEAEHEKTAEAFLQVEPVAVAVEQKQEFLMERLELQTLVAVEAEEQPSIFLEQAVQVL
jgi:hypothetical protein